SNSVPVEPRTSASDPKRAFAFFVSYRTDRGRGRGQDFHSTRSSGRGGSMKLRRFVILSSLFVCFSTTAPAFARTIVVDNDFADCPQADFNSIQLAINAAEPGDKTLVCPGVYV